MVVKITNRTGRPNPIGGGWSFLNNFLRHSTLQYKIQTNNEEDITDYDVLFVVNPMCAERKDFEHAKDNNKRIVLRLDNIPSDEANRGTAISKLRDYIPWADYVVFQSVWAQDKYAEFATANGLRFHSFSVIHNGVDTDLFSPDGDNIVDKAYPKILFVKSGRNENKRYPEAMEMFRRVYAKNNNAKLYLVGQFADDFHKYNFGFYNGENYQYLGMVPHEQMPMVYRSADILYFPAFADAAPNTVLEAMSCGVVPIVHPYGGGFEFTEGVAGIHECEVQWNDILNGTSMIEDALRVDRQAIRDHVIKNFNIKDCVRKYEETIHGIAV